MFHIFINQIEKSKKEGMDVLTQIFAFTPFRIKIRIFDNKNLIYLFKTPSQNSHFKKGRW